MIVGRKKRIFISTFIIVIIFFFALECTARVYWSVKNSNFRFMWNYHNCLKKNPLPYVNYGNYRKFKPGRYKRPSGNIFTVNSKGFRGKEFNDKNDKLGVTRIGCIGASSTFGAYLSDKETWPYILQENLESVEILNFGIQGAKITSSLAMFKEELINYDLDMCLIYSGINNYYDYVETHINSKKSLNLERLKGILLDSSLFFRLLVQKIAVVSKGSMDLAYSAKIANPYPKYIENKRDFDRAFDIAKIAFSEFAQEAKANNIKIVFILQALDDEIEDELIFLLQDRINEVITEVAEKESIPVINAEEEFDKVKYSNFEHIVNFDKEGAELLADIITCKLQEMGLIEEARQNLGEIYEFR